MKILLLKSGTLGDIVLLFPILNSLKEKESKYLMLDFYQALNFEKNNKQLSYADALRKAKLEMIKQDLKPVFWAGLVLLGR